MEHLRSLNKGGKIMNKAKRDLIKRAERNEAIADLIGWLILASGGFILAKFLLMGLQIFFSLQGIH